MDDSAKRKGFMKQQHEALIEIYPNQEGGRGMTHDCTLIAKVFSAPNILGCEAANADALISLVVAFIFGVGMVIFFICGRGEE